MTDHKSKTPRTVTTSSGKTHHIFFGYFVVFALILAICIPLASAINACGIFYTSLGKYFDTSTGILSYFTSFVWGSGLITLPFMGRLLDRVDSRIIVAGSCLLIALCFLWFAFMVELWQYFVGAFVLGQGVTMLNLMAPSTIVNRWFAKRAGFYVGLIMAFSGVGGLIFSSLGGSLILTIGWSGTYLVFAALSAATVPVCWFCIRSFPSDKGLQPYGVELKPGETLEEQKAALAAAEGGMTAHQAYHTKMFIIIAALAFLMNFVMYTYYIIPSYADQLPVGLAFPMLGAIASSCAMGAQTVTKLSMGALSDKQPFMGTLVCFTLGALGILTLAFGGGSSMLIYIGSIGYGLFHGTVNVMLPVFTEMCFGNKDYAKIYSRISMAACGASVCNGLICGTIIHAMNSYYVVFVGLAVLLVVAMVLVVILWRIQKQRVSSDPWDHSKKDRHSKKTGTPSSDQALPPSEQVHEKAKDHSLGESSPSPSEEVIYQAQRLRDQLSLA